MKEEISSTVPKYPHFLAVWTQVVTFSFPKMLFEKEEILWRDENFISLINILYGPSLTHFKYESINHILFSIILFEKEKYYDMRKTLSLFSD
jgi:hypothetical protein